MERGKLTLWGKKAVGLKGMSLCTLSGMVLQTGCHLGGKSVSSHLSLALALAAGPFSVNISECVCVCEILQVAVPNWDNSVKLCEAWLTTE